MPDDQEDLFATQDETDDGRPSGMRQVAPKSGKGPDPIAQRVSSHHEGWRIGMCEGAAAFRKALLRKLDAEPSPLGDHYAELLATIGEVDDEFRNRFPEEYDRQLQIRTKDE